MPTLALPNLSFPLPLRRSSIIRRLQRLSVTSLSRPSSRLNISPPTNPRHVSGHSFSPSSPLSVPSPGAASFSSSAMGFGMHPLSGESSMFDGSMAILNSGVIFDGLSPMPVAFVREGRAGRVGRRHEEDVLEPRPLEWCQGIGEVLGEQDRFF
jgi:hypothetical protein